MTEHDKPIRTEKNAETSPKKPYKKPEFRYERVFETMALQCGKIVGGGSGCHPRPRRS